MNSDKTIHPTRASYPLSTAGLILIGSAALALGGCGGSSSGDSSDDEDNITPVSL